MFRKKKAYVAHFLINVDVPNEFMQNEDVKETHQVYEKLKQQFKTYHKAVEKLRKSEKQPGELKHEITQLEEERAQLKDKIKSLKSKTSDLRGFKELLEITSALRREQEEETKLLDRMQQQQDAFRQAMSKHQDVVQQWVTMKNKNKSLEDMSAEDLLNRLNVEVSEMKAQVKNQIPLQFKKRKDRLNRLQDEIMKTPKTEKDVLDLDEKIQVEESRIRQLKAELHEANSKNQDHQTDLYRQQAAMVSRKLTEQQFELEENQAETEELKAAIEDKDAILCEMSGPKFMKREEFKQYATQLRSKTNKYKSLKTELTQLQSESVVLNRTEQILKARDENLSEFMAQREQEKGVSGYQNTEKELQEISKKKTSTDREKGQTLEEISKIVTDINIALKDRKNKLAPQIKELRSVRQQFQELEQFYLKHKKTYENTAAGLESERLKLEQECEKLQNKALQEESRYHYLNCLHDIASVQLEKVQDQEELQKLSGRPRGVKTIMNSYNQKIATQIEMKKTLMKQHKKIKENEKPYLKQKSMFENLQRLLSKKKEVLTKNPKAEPQIETQYDNIAGANVMKFDS
jgi:intraflagellar transport protein 81